MKSVPPRVTKKNYSSLAEHPTVVAETMRKWEKMQVFREVETEPWVVSPLGLVEEDGKFRVVLDAKATRLNKHLIAPKFKLPSHSQVISKLQQGDYLIKADFESGFLQLPIDEEEQKFLGFVHPISGKFCVFQKLAFGLRSAAFLFHSFSSVLKQFLFHALGMEAEAYIDDWLFHGHSAEEVRERYEIFLQICRLLGIHVNHSKTAGPLTALTFLGLIIDTINSTLSLPEEKRSSFLKAVNRLLNHEGGTMADLTSTAGKLAHTSAIHPAGWACTQVFWDILYDDHKYWTKKALRSTHYEEQPLLKDTLTWWARTLENPITRKIWQTEEKRLFLWGTETARSHMRNAVTITTDASDHGWGASWGLRTCYGTWQGRQTTTSINWREIKAVILAIAKWNCVRDTPVLVLVDNSTAVCTINRRNPKATGLKQLVQELIGLERERNVQITAWHLPGCLNDLADGLSRGLPKAAALPLPIDTTTLGGAQATRIGLIQPSLPLLRTKQLSPPKGEFIIACSTPAIPALLAHLECWKRDALPTKGKIIIPDIPSSYRCQLPQMPEEQVGAIYPGLQRVGWIALTWDSACVTWCTRARDAAGGFLRSEAFGSCHGVEGAAPST